MLTPCIGVCGCVCLFESTILDTEVSSHDRKTPLLIQYSSRMDFSLSPSSVSLYPSQSPWIMWWMVFLSSSPSRSLAQWGFLPSCLALRCTTLLHELHLSSGNWSEWVGGSENRLVVHHGLWGHNWDPSHLSHLRRDYSIHRHLRCGHGEGHGSRGHVGHRHGSRWHGGRAPGSRAAHGFGLPVRATGQLLLPKLCPLHVWLFAYWSSKLQISNKVGQGWVQVIGQ